MNDIINELNIEGKIFDNPFGSNTIESNQTDIRCVDDIKREIESMMDQYPGYILQVSIKVKETETNKEEYSGPMITMTLREISDSSAWDEFVKWKGWDYYVGHRISAIGDWNELVQIPVPLAKEWGLI